MSAPEATRKRFEMCQFGQSIDLFEGEKCQITFCKGCKTFSLVYSNCCASFTLVEMQQFKHVLKHLKEEDFHYDFTGQQMTIVKNPLAWIGFCLTRQDVHHLLGAVQESLVLYDAFHIIYH